MRADIWENTLALNAHVSEPGEAIQPAATWTGLDKGRIVWDRTRLDLEAALARDPHPLPSTPAREGYYGANHFDYWASGLRDFQMLSDCARDLGHDVRSYLDLGCASGRVLRHFALQADGVRAIGTDLNRAHIEWIYRHLPTSVLAFQNHALPSLPLADGSVSMVSAFSVFTHIETFDVAWLMELARVMEPGGIAWLTAHTEHTWAELDSGWPLHKALARHQDYTALVGDRDAPGERPPFSGERAVFRWSSERSYSANVFVTTDYIHSVWGRVFDIVEIRRRHPAFQDVVICRKRA